MKRFLCCVCALLLAGGALFLGCRGGRVGRGVVVDGVPVGGMRYAEAERCLRAGLRRIPFTLHTPVGDVSPDLSYTDDLGEVLLSARRGGEYAVTVRREWVDAEERLREICERCVLPPQDAALSFSRRGFVYRAERAGRYCDAAASLSAALAALARGEEEASLVVKAWQPAVTVAMLKERTQKLSSFTTYFSGEKTARVHNISLACERIAGSVLASGEEFSFNQAVGVRTRENGFLDAPVIVQGEFVEGAGGGVCQASTTLMGAALRAGLSVTESRPHSLSVGYVPPSQDAMVSRASDLKFRNPYPFPVYLLGNVGEGYVRFEVYGMPDGRRYVPESRVIRRIPPPPAEVVRGEEEKTLRAEKEGLVSECYLLVYAADGALLEKKLLRRDTYACVQGKLQVVAEEVPPQ